MRARRRSRCAGRGRIPKTRSVSLFQLFERQSVLRLTKIECGNGSRPPRPPGSDCFILQPSVLLLFWLLGPFFRIRSTCSFQNTRFHSTVSPEEARKYFSRNAEDEEGSEKKDDLTPRRPAGGGATIGPHPHGPTTDNRTATPRGAHERPRCGHWIKRDACVDALAPSKWPTLQCTPRKSIDRPW